MLEKLGQGSLALLRSAINNRELSRRNFDREKKYLHGHVSFCLVRTFFDTEQVEYQALP